MKLLRHTLLLAIFLICSFAGSFYYFKCPINGDLSFKGCDCVELEGACCNKVKSCCSEDDESLDDVSISDTCCDIQKLSDDITFNQSESFLSINDYTCNTSVNYFSAKTNSLTQVNRFSVAPKRPPPLPLYLYYSSILI